MKTSYNTAPGFSNIANEFITNKSLDGNDFTDALVKIVNLEENLQQNKKEIEILKDLIDDGAYR